MPTKKPKKLKIKRTPTNTGIKVHDLSVQSPPTHKPTSRLTAVANEKAVSDFVTGFGFPKGMFTTGTKTHDDFSKVFGKRGK